MRRENHSFESVRQYEGGQLGLFSPQALVHSARTCCVKTGTRLSQPLGEAWVSKNIIWDQKKILLGSKKYSNTMQKNTGKRHLQRRTWSPRKEETKKRRNKDTTKFRNEETKKRGNEERRERRNEETKTRGNEGTKKRKNKQTRKRRKEETKKRRNEDMKEMRNEDTKK